MVNSTLSPLRSKLRFCVGWSNQSVSLPISLPSIFIIIISRLEIKAPTQKEPRPCRGELVHETPSRVTPTSDNSCGVTQTAKAPSSSLEGIKRLATERIHGWVSNAHRVNRFHNQWGTSLYTSSQSKSNSVLWTGHVKACAAVRLSFLNMPSQW